MLTRIRSQLTFANVVSSPALFIALGGGAYALTLPSNSVGTRQIKRDAATRSKIRAGAIDSSKVKDATLLAADFKAGQLPKGDKGDKGDPGASAVKFFASARADGTLLSGSGGVSVTKYAGQTGAYQVVLPANVTSCVAVANVGESTGNGMPAGQATSRTNGHAAPEIANTVDVITFNSAGALANLPFNVAVLC